MNREYSIRPAGVDLISMKYHIAAFIGLMLILLTEGFTLQPRREAADLHLQTSAPTVTVSEQDISSEPRYYKKELVFKRIVAESEASSIRTSAQTDGYKALMSIPLPVVMPQFSVRMPQFLHTSVLNNFQALSTLGTPQYYSNLNVQQYLNNMNTQQYLNNMTNQQYLNNMNTQQYLNNMNTQQYLNNMNNWENNLTNQQYLNNMNTQQYLNNMNNWQNNMTNQQYLNNMNNQQYLNNFNNYTSPMYNQPTFTQPMPQIYNPPTYYNPPPSFNTWP